MGKNTHAAVLRIAIVALLGILVLAYVEMVKHPGGSTWRFPAHAGLLRQGCPVDPEDRADYGAADYDWRLTALDGRELSFAEFKDEVVFVNVWATWCGPCVAEMPSIQRLHDAVSQDGIAFVLVSEEDEAEVREFVQSGGYTFPVYLSKSLPQAFVSETIPATFIVDRGGRVVLSRLGTATWDGAACLGFLRALHQEGAPAPARP